MRNQISAKHIMLGTLGFIVISFFVQAMSHFVINVEHYNSISFARKEPILALGFIFEYVKTAVEA